MTVGIRAFGGGVLSNMADSGEQEQGAGVSMVEEQTSRGRRKGTTKPRDPSRAREDLGDMEVRLAKMERHLITGDDRFEEIESRLMELGEGLEETRGELQAAFSDALERLISENEALKIAHAEEISAIKEKNRLLKEEVERMNDEVKDELVLLKVWWRRRMFDMEKGTCCIKTWDEFKQELKRQLYPEHAADEARAKLRRLTQRGTIREYVKEFSEILLEIPEYPDQELLFFFKDKLQAWAKLEVERRGAQSLATTITITESLLEYKKSEKPKHKDGKCKIMGRRVAARKATKKVRRRERTRSLGMGRKENGAGSTRGMDFMDKVRAIPIPFANSLCIVESSGACMVPLKRKNRGSTLSALQLAKGIRKNEPTFLVALQAKDVSGAMDMPHEPNPSLMERIMEGLQHDPQAK
ncbi:hypothetical protein GH714_020949 [Hevea brasiliensis]|uniref:Retrotransposon gag domain-containing protein n=1 Tax=Hevea brasiliensis TaxID=3981 RepID=A0A6A6MJN6_HEVBR|nr:hypothetical protein GH714_020949 [Hevea brasiliensis]